MSDIQIKGPSLNYIFDFIEEKCNGRKNEWFDNLPTQSRQIFSEMILSTKWYDLNLSHVEGIKTLAKTFFNDDVFKAAYEMGKFGGKKALTGIYKIFIMIPSVEFVVKKVSTIASTYYSEGIKIEVTDFQKDKNLDLTINGFNIGQELMFPNIAGWIDNLMSIISKKKYTVTYSSITVPNDKIQGAIKVTFE